MAKGQRLFEVTSGCMCLWCRHIKFGGGCAAFPAGIPGEIGRRQADHRKPYPGDHGIRFEEDPERGPVPWFVFIEWDRPIAERIRGKTIVVEAFTGRDWAKIATIGPDGQLTEHSTRWSEKRLDDLLPRLDQYARTSIYRVLEVGQGGEVKLWNPLG